MSSVSARPIDAQRLLQVIAQATGSRSRIDQWGAFAPTSAGDTIGANAYLKVDGDDIALQLFPADTLTQARAFYSRLDLVDAVLAMRSSGWHVKPNFHFGHFERGFCWNIETMLDVEQYARLWCQRIGSETAVPRSRWNDYWTWLQREQIASPADRTGDFQLHFDATKRRTAVPRPGLELSRTWPRAEAEELDARGALVPAVHAALDQALRTCGAQPPIQRSG